MPTRGLAGELGRLSGEDGGLASIGFADDEAHDVFRDEANDVFRDDVNDVFRDETHDQAGHEAAYEEIAADPDEIDYRDDDPDPPTVLDRSPRRVGHRAEGWVRPEYRDFHPSESGDYWTPLPGDQGRDREPSASGYGWPVQVERLPPVPSYQPATGFDLQPVATEPTEVVPSWTPGDDGRDDRVRLPRTWSAKDEKPRRRPRPRPRPAAGIEGDGVYVSRHAADPPR